MLVARLLGNCVTVSCGGGVCSSDSDRYGSGFGSGTGSFGEMDVKRRRRKLMSVVRSILDNAAYYGMAFMDEQRERLRLNYFALGPYSKVLTGFKKGQLLLIKL